MLDLGNNSNKKKYIFNFPLENYYTGIISIKLFKKV